MLETHITPSLIEAQRRAHEERAALFTSLFRAVPRAFAGRRYR